VRIIHRLAALVLGALTTLAAGQQSPEEAEERYSAQVKNQPSDAAAWKALGLLRASRGRLEAAAEALQHACTLRPADEESCYYYGRSLFALGRYDAAVQPLETALRATPRDRRWRVQRALARNFEWLGRAADAERSFREAIRLSRGRATLGEDPRVDFGSFLYRQGRTEEAMVPLQEAAEAKPSQARAHMELGRVLLQLDLVGAAAEALEKAVRLDPRDWSAHLLLGRAYLRLGRAADAEREMQTGQQGLERSQGSSTVR
jgi:Flp pilus assembly protein TadD